ncbi:MAG: hypothetical protein JSV22_09945, partial [Bacteroidales bacterium]
MKPVKMKNVLIIIIFVVFFGSYPQAQDCECINWAVFPSIQVKLEDNPEFTILTCNETLSDIPVGTHITINGSHGLFQCTEIPGCVVEYEWELNGPSGPIRAGLFSELPTSFTAAVAGTYSLIIKPGCGDECCDICAIYFEVPYECSCGAWDAENPLRVSYRLGADQPVEVLNCGDIVSNIERDTEIIIEGIYGMYNCTET